MKSSRLSSSNWNNQRCTDTAPLAWISGTALQVCTGHRNVKITQFSALVQLQNRLQTTSLCYRSPGDLSTDPIESFEDVGGSEIQLIENDPVTFTHRFHENTFNDVELILRQVKQDIAHMHKITTNRYSTVNPTQDCYCSTVQRAQKLCRKPTVDNITVSRHALRVRLVRINI